MNQEIVQEFKFEKGAPGSVLYGRIATLKHEDSTIDLAYVFFFLEFKLSPKKIEERRRKKFLFITYGSHTVVRFEERNLSEKDKEHISDFYRIKALNSPPWEKNTLNCKLYVINDVYKCRSLVFLRKKVSD